MGFCALVSSFGDYSGINEDLDPTFDKIIKFAHQSVIELNEYGTEAAAFTSGGVKNLSILHFVGFYISFSHLQLL